MAVIVTLIRAAIAVGVVVVITRPAPSAVISQAPPDTGQAGATSSPASVVDATCEAVATFRQQVADAVDADEDAARDTADLSSARTGVVDLVAGTEAAVNQLVGTLQALQIAGRRVPGVHDFEGALITAMSGADSKLKRLVTDANHMPINSVAAFISARTSIAAGVTNAAPGLGVEVTLLQQARAPGMSALVQAFEFAPACSQSRIST